MSAKKIVVPQDTRFVDDEGRLTPQWVHFLSDLARVLNDLRVRVEKLEPPP
jgi:hypothetical protein